MRLFYADYNMQTNSVDITTFGNYILRIDCNKAEGGLRTTLSSQYALNALALDNLLEYARLALDGEIQAWVDGRCRKCIHNVRSEEGGVALSVSLNWYDRLK